MPPAGVNAENRGVERDTYRLGGWAGIAVGIAYVVITGLYVVGGQMPGSVDGAAWLTYVGERTAVAWGIIGLSVITDMLYLPIAAAVVVALGPSRRVPSLVGATLLALFVVIDLATTWASYGSLMRLADAEPTAAVVAAATYAAATFHSSLFAVYVILVPSIGIFILSALMLQEFSRAAGWTGIATGIVGAVAVLGGFVAPALGTLAIPASILTAAWVVIVGYRLLRLAGSVQAR